MSLTVVLGGQFGGEGKGSIVAYLAQSGRFAALVKTGGPNSAHSYGSLGVLHRVRMVPSGASLTEIPIIFPAGSLIHIETLFREVEALGLRNQLVVHPQAGIVTNDHVSDQAGDDFYRGAGSTLTGTGAASALRAKRRLGLAKDEPRLAQYLAETSEYLARLSDRGAEVLVEGAQGYGLSNYHGDYPYVSSRDCTVGAVLSQVGLGPRHLGDVLLVAKCFPTRNSHGCGRLPFEIDLSTSPEMASALAEVGGGSFSSGDAPRRVAFFDFEVVERAIRANSPTALALTGLDRLNSLQNVDVVQRRYGTPTAFIERLETTLQTTVRLEGWGPYVEDVREKPLHDENAA